MGQEREIITFRSACLHKVERSSYLELMVPTDENEFPCFLCSKDGMHEHQIRGRVLLDPKAGRCLVSFALPDVCDNKIGDVSVKTEVPIEENAKTEEQIVKNQEQISTSAEKPHEVADKNPSSFQCSKCLQVFSTKRLLRKHEHNHSPGTAFRIIASKF